MTDVEFIGLTDLGFDIVKGLSKMEDPNYVELIDDKKFILKRWQGKIDGHDAYVFEQVQTKVRDGDKVICYSNLRIRSNGQDYTTADWIDNPLLDNKTKKHDKAKGHFKHK